ncbi:MAG: hypothetical protein D6775_05060 [Caldilineae bacterium]|nr:MAG: hypothetical protein D6775_05060 [Caldilineae bacterium]
MLPRLRVTLLGGLSIELDGQPLGSFRSRTAEALFVYLLLHKRSFSRRQLAEFFWEGRDEKQAAANLRTVLSMLNKQLGGFMKIGRQTVGIDTNQAIAVDVWQFEQGLAALLEAETNAPDALDEALRLYRGEFLEGFYLSEAPRFQEWEVVQRERLQHLASQGFRRRIAIALRQGDAETALALAERLVQIDPYEEECHRLLMEALLRSGRRTTALRRFQELRGLLHAELGIEPDETTVALAERIRRLVWPPPCKVPRSPTPLIGRAAELDTVKTMLHAHALVTILGPGGMGKTRLAVAVAQACCDEAAGYFLDGVYFIPLSSLTTPQHIPTAVAETLGMLLSDREQVAEQVLDYLHDRECLLVLDNFEHLIGPGSLEFLDEMLHRAPHVRLLITSRERLGQPNEAVYDLQGLSRDTAAGQNDAVALFLYHARRLRHDYVPDKAEQEALTRFCTMVEGMPLAIQLGAAWIRHRSAAEIAEEAAVSLDLLSAPRGREHDRHGSVRGVLAASWQRLPPDEQQSLARLGIFAGRFTQAAARQVAAVPRQILFDLVDRSLLRPAGDERFDLHPLVQQFAREQLRASGDWAKVAAAHAAYFHQMLVQAGEELLSARRAGENPAQVLVRLHEAIADLRAAWQWLQAHPQAMPPAEVAAFVDGFGLFLAFASWYQEAIALYERALQIWSVGDVVRSHWLHQLANAQFGLGLTNEAEATFQQALALLGRPFPRRESRLKLSITRMLARQLQRRAFAASAPQPSSHVPTPAAEAIQIYEKLSRIFYYQGRRSAFTFATLAALTLAEQSGDQSAMARGYANMCIGMAFVGYHNWARYYRRRARHIGERQPDIPTRAYVLLVTGVYDGMVGNWSEGQPALQAAQKIYEKLGDRQQWGESLTVWATNEYAQGRFALAAEAWEHLRMQAEHTGNRLHQAWGLTGQAGALLILGNTRQAERLLRRSITILEHVNSAQNLLTARAFWALALYRLGRHSRALAQAEASRQLLTGTTPAFTTVVASFGSLAEVYLGLADLGSALKPEAALSPGDLLARGDAITAQFLDFTTVVTAGAPRALIYRGLYLWQCGKLEAAHRHWQQALVRAQALSMPYEAARAHLELALHPLPERSDNGHLTQAYTELSSLQASYDLQRIEQGG